MTLRYYQQDAADACLSYLTANPGKSPILVLPTAAGKSHIIAELCRLTLQYKATKILVITHVKELIIQNHAKMPLSLNAGIYSAGVGRRNTHNRVIFAGIQSIYKKPELFAPIDLILIDECHLLGPDQDTMYQAFLSGLPEARIVGLTATPFRTKGGMLTAGEDGLFDDIAYDISVAELIDKGFLSPLISKSGVEQPDLAQVKLTAGDYNKKAMASAFDQDPITRAAIAEINTYGAERKSWLIFSSSVQHAFHIQDYIPGSEVITGETDKDERDQIIRAFKAGHVKCIINYGVLTTGFDAPAVDLIVLLRGTKSTGLYVQMLGRGMRVSPETGKENCLVLDYGGNIERHGPVDAITIIPKRQRNGDITMTISIQPTKICPECRSDNHAIARMCGVCGYEYPIEVSHDKEASEAAIMAKDVPAIEHTVDDVVYAAHVAKKSGFTLLKVTYICSMGVFIDWVSIENEAARKFYHRWWFDRTGGTPPPDTVEAALKRTDEITIPETITTRKENGFDRIIAYKGQKAIARCVEEVNGDCYELGGDEIVW